MKLTLLRGWPSGDPVPAISIRQPWATAVVFLGKDVENRSHWLYKYRGPLLIHASGSTLYVEDVDEMLANAREDGCTDAELKPFHLDADEGSMYPQGYIVGVVQLVDVFGQDDKIPKDHRAAGSPWGEEDSPFWLCFADPEPCVPLKYKGKVGLFKVPVDVATSLKPLPD